MRHQQCLVAESQARCRTNGTAAKPYIHFKTVPDDRLLDPEYALRSGLLVR